jgi:kynurenine formamidase
MDFISISSLADKEKGREAHRAFLKRGILLFEDMSLKGVNATAKIQSVIALPLRFSGADGSPVTVIAYLN